VTIDQLPRTLWWEDGRVRLIDQSRLPLTGDVLECASYDGVCWAISGMAVRGAPALGVAGAMALALFAQNESAHIDEVEDFLSGLDVVGDEIAATRPTAVNLAWGVERVKEAVRAKAAEGAGLDELRAATLEEALAIAQEDEAANREMGRLGAELLPESPQILTHCNAGSLATAYYGTALGVIFAAHEAGKEPRVWVDETRPVLQGSRLTLWELMRVGVPAKLIADNMAGMLMAAGAVDVVLVGADRIAANGDVANKIGTYSLAVLADAHDVPFYVVAPTSTVDLTTPTGDEIPIEERDAFELSGVTFSGVFQPADQAAADAFSSVTTEGPYVFDFQGGHELVLTRKEGESAPSFQVDGWARTAPTGADVFNPAFDVTPAKLITAIVTERGVARPDYEESLARVCAGSGAIHEVGTPADTDTSA
jgi:methylthioribose-1-phosphate isomerase